MAKTKYLTRADILDADDRPIEEVPVPEWFDGVVRCMGLTGEEKDAYQISCMVSPGKSDDVDMQNASAKLVALCVIDEAGNLLFKEGDVLRLGKKNGKALSRVYSVCADLSGLSEKSLEMASENLKSGQNGDSISS